MIKISFIILLLVICCCSQKQETADLRIDLKTFDRKVISRISFMLDKKPMEIADAIDLVRLSNTISYNDTLHKRKFSKEYKKLFFLNIQGNVLDC